MEHATKPQQSILAALEANGFQPENHCRNGFCGMCRSKVNPEDIDNIKITGEAIGYHDAETEILPCVCYLAEGKLDIEINTTGDKIRLLHHSEATLIPDTNISKLDDELATIPTTLSPGVIPTR